MFYMEFKLLFYRVIFKYIICFFILLFLFSCNFNFINIVDQKKQEFNYPPTKAIIDINNNGVISFRDRIFKIKNLEITNEEISLGFTNLNNRLISSMSYFVNKNGNGFLVYSLDHVVEFLKRGDYKTLEPLSIKHYLIPIKANEFFTSKIKLIIDNDLIGKSIDVYSDDNILCLFYNRNYLKYSAGRYYTDGLKGEFSLKLVNLNNFNIEDKFIQFYKMRIESDNDFFLDKNGNGFITNYPYKSLGKIVNYKKTVEYFEDKIDHNIFSKNFLDFDGNGSFISDYSIYKEREIFFSTYKNYERLKIEKIHIDQSFRPAERFITENYRKDSVKYPLLVESSSYFDNTLISKFFNKKGDGILFLEPSDNSSGLYAQKVSLFKIQDKVDQIIDKKSKFKYYDYAINENGNGLIFLTDGKIFKSIKVFNFEVKVN